jgi:transcriptional regulator GlxA family with amidase domain
VDAALFRPDVPPGLQVADPVDGAQAVFARLHEVVDDGSVAAGGLRSALIAEMFWLLVRALPEAGLARPFRPRDDDREFATRLQRLFDDLGADTLPVAVLARRLGLTANALTHRCRETLGVAPARALRHHRLDRARALIETSDLPVREVALRLGFADPFHFSRAFKRHHGIPPSALR